MGKSFFTSDWHVGEAPAPNTHSFLRSLPTDSLLHFWMAQCNSVMTPEDTLYFLGDLGITLEDLTVYQHLLPCRKILILGDKEYANKNFTRAECLAELERLGIFHEVHESLEIDVGDLRFFAAHKPTDCLAQTELPALCGHIHGIWRTQYMPERRPIINVGIDAWGGIVSEDFILHQYNAVTKGFYDVNAFPQQWEKAFPPANLVNA